MAMIIVNLGRILGERRLRMAEVSRQTGISKKTLSLLYRGKNQGIQFRTLDRLCALLECSVAEILEVEQKAADT